MQVLTTAPRPASPQDDCKAAWLTKAQALHALGRHTEALADMQALSQTFGNDAQVSHALQRASFEVRKEKRPDYYALLKVPSIASIMEIKSAYKQRALEYHPDKHTESEGARRAAEEKFKLLGEALEILGDEFQRKLYDEGYDKAAIAERVQAANRAAHSHSKDGCCGGGCHE
jgi:DnaJ homolog subfamily C member 7